YCGLSVESGDINSKNNQLNANNDQKAIDLYEKAILALNSNKANPKTAFTLLQESAQLNHQKAKELVAKSHIFADHLPFNAKKAIKYLQSIPTNESSGAHLLLGFVYAFGLGVDSDQEKALLHYTLAANLDNSLAKMAVGFRYLYGIGEEKNCRKALDLYHSVATNVVDESHTSGGQIIRSHHLWQQKGGLKQSLDTDLIDYYRFLAKKGDISAAVTLGQLYYFGGFGVERDGWVESLYHIGLMYLNGLGVARDYRQAVRFFTFSLQSQHLLAFYNLGQLYAGGHGVPKSCAKAVYYFKSVAERGVWSQELTDADNYHKNRNVLQAFLKYTFLSELGYESAQSNSAFILDNQPIRGHRINDNERPILAFKYWTQSAEQGMSYSRIKVGDCHYYGLGTPVDYEMAAHYYRKASEYRYSSQALFNLGYLHEKGLGVKRDTDMALIFYEMSAQIDSDARVAVVLAKQKAKLFRRIEKVFNLFDLRNYFGNKWDLVLISVLVIALIFVVYIKMNGNYVFNTFARI
ncbi:unnamed protein product, partial [Medioppia subpectinata]